jgi:hypothetical protein
MPSEFRDPKTLSDWIQLDYFRRPRGLRRWRSWLGWGTLIACALAVGVILVLPRGKVAFQAGPVSSAHSLFHGDCERCHKDSFQTAKRLWPGNSTAVHVVPDDACSKCHDGPAHNEKQQTVPSCASCHREHRGRTQLARVSDNYCTSCHADLKKNLRPGTEPAFQDVGGFPAAHPEFRSLPDPGRLRFNHKVHLKKDVRNCSTCHKQDAAGRYMLPIQYTEHCASCHPLSVKLSGLFTDEKLKAVAFKFDKVAAPHKDPAIVRGVLRERLIGFVRENSVLSKEVTLPREIPRPQRLAAITEREWVWSKTKIDDLLFGNEQLLHSEGLLYDRSGGCVLCHIQKGPVGAIPRGSDDLPEYEKTQLPKRWFKHSRFGHDSHRMLACTECHAAPESIDTSDVLMPKMTKTCARCHNSNTGVRDDCVECHVYHDRERGYEASKWHTIAEILKE